MIQRGLITLTLACVAAATAGASPLAAQAGKPGAYRGVCRQANAAVARAATV